MKNVCAAIVASVLVVILLVMRSEALPVEAAEEKQLVDRTVRSALDGQLSGEDAIEQLLYRYLEEIAEQESKDKIYANKRVLSGIPGLDTLNMMTSKARANGYRYSGRRRRSMEDLF